jgi:hypothetical protein
LKELHPNDYALSEVPELKKPSDIMWFMWKEFVAADRIRDLHFFISVSIENEPTLQLMKRALDSEGVDLTKERTRFDTDTDAGRALVSM